MCGGGGERTVDIRNKDRERRGGGKWGRKKKKNRRILSTISVPIELAKCTSAGEVDKIEQI